MNKKVLLILMFIMILAFTNICFATSLINSGVELKNYTNNILVDLQNMNNDLNELSKNTINLNIVKQCFNLFNIVFYSVFGVIIFNIFTKFVAVIINKLMKKFRLFGKKNNLDRIMKSIREEAFYRVS